MLNFRIPIFIITPTKAFISSTVTSCYHVEIEQHCTGIWHAHSDIDKIYSAKEKCHKQTKVIEGVVVGGSWKFGSLSSEQHVHGKVVLLEDEGQLW